MTERATPEDSAAGPFPDLGFFAGPPVGGAGSPFGGQQFGGTSTANQFGTAPAVNQFGGPPALTSFGTPTHHPEQPRPTGPSNGSTTKVVAGVLGLVLLVGAVLGGRFTWRHFFDAPELPETLLGAPRLTDPSLEAGLREAQEGVGAELTAGSEAKVALYSDGQGLGFMLFALRGSGRPGDDDTAMEGWAESEHGKAQCFSKPAQAEVGLGVTFCVRGFFRRAVVVMAFGLTPPDPVMVARGTDEAWRAQ